MLKLKIRIFKNDDPTPETTITVPLGVLRVASAMMPRRVASLLEAHGIDLMGLIGAARTDEPLGTLVEIEEHRRNRKTVVSIE